MRESQKNAPVKTGFLRNSPYLQDEEQGCSLRWACDYAFYQEYGTSTIPAKAFVRRAMDEHSKDIINNMQAELNKEVKEKFNG
jgi:HK97 gp10 family phage protein